MEQSREKTANAGSGGKFFFGAAKERSQCFQDEARKQKRDCYQCESYAGCCIGVSCSEPGEADGKDILAET